MRRSVWLGTVAQLALAAAAQSQPAPNAHPTGGNVVAGSAAIAQSATTTTINQSTQRAAINWQGFDVGSQQTVQFRQPSATASTLNRVVGPNPSQIAGRIDANGQVIITNQSGVVFYKGAQVNTAGLMVAAAGISNANFMAGRMVFDQPANPNAAIRNQGTITIRQAGLAALVAPQVANSGVINARLGHVVLAGAKAATLDLYGDGLLSIDVTGAVTQAPNGATALVTNTGTIRADGGIVQLTARAADGVVTTLVDAGGRVRANSTGGNTGTVVLNGVGGDITVSGQLVASGAAPGTSGGRIAVDTSGNVTIASTARLDASGRSGGGVIALGTTLARAAGGPGTPSQQTAANVTVQRGARIAANATSKGNGGRVTVLAAQNTTMNGAISATGGPHGGNGGFVEVSGTTLGMDGSVDVAAPAGTIGTLLLDPINLDVVPRAGTLDGDVPPNGAGIFYGSVSVDSSGNETVSNRAIDDSTANVILQATNNLTVDPNTPITLRPGVTLSLQTQTGNIVVSAGSPITAGTGGSLVFQAGMTAGSGGTLSLNDNLTTDSAHGITLQADGGIALNAAHLTSGSLVLSTVTGGGISQAAGGVITTGVLVSPTGIAGGATLTAGGNAIGALGPMTVTGGTLSITNGAPLTILGPVNADYLNITATGRMTLAGSITTFGAPLAQQSGATPAPQGSTLQVLPSSGTAQFIQTSSVTVVDPPATTLRVQLPASGGSASFANLAAPGSNLVLALGNGTATGTMQVGGLLVLGQGGSATLIGSLAGVTTATAATLGQILPAVDPHYTFNGCTIGAAACGSPGGNTGGPPGGNPGGPPGGNSGGSPGGNPGVPPNGSTGSTPILVNIPQPVPGGMGGFLPGTHPPPPPILTGLNLTVLPTLPLVPGQLAPTDVVPPNISFEDY